MHFSGLTALMVLGDACDSNNRLCRQVGGNMKVRMAGVQEGTNFYFKLGFRLLKIHWEKCRQPDNQNVIEFTGQVLF